MYSFGFPLASLIADWLTSTLSDHPRYIFHLISRVRIANGLDEFVQAVHKVGVAAIDIGAGAFVVHVADIVGSAVVTRKTYILPFAMICCAGVCVANVVTAYVGLQAGVRLADVALRAFVGIIHHIACVAPRSASVRRGACIGRA